MPNKRLGVVTMSITSLLRASLLNFVVGVAVRI